MPEPGVPCQLEFFGDRDFSPVEEALPASESPSPINRSSAPPSIERVQRETKARAGEGIYDETKLTILASDLISRAGLPKLALKVSVHWNHRMRTAAGRAYYETLRVELNPGLLQLEGIDVEAEVDRTLRHELAHLVAFHRARDLGRKISAHGKEWRQACAELGIPDESRCHTLPFKPRRVRKSLIYACPVCENEVPRVRKFRQPVACYDCCRKFNRGRYDQRFRLVAKRAPQA